MTTAAFPVKVAIIALGLYRSSGGPSKTIGAFRDALGAEVYSLVQSDRAGREPFAIEETRPIVSSRLPLLKQFCFPTKQSSRALWKGMAGADLLSCHSFYRYHVEWVAQAGRRLHKPYWFVPHGVLDPWVMTSGTAQKKLFWQLIGNRFLEGASTVIFATEAERDQAAAQFELPASDVIPWPVDPVDLNGRDEARSRIRQMLNIPLDARVLLYFGRLHTMKQPLETIAAVADAREENLHLIVVGNEETVSLSSCRQLARERNIEKRVHLVGPVYGAEKFAFLHASDAYISLSHRENFNHTAAESLAAALPVILSPGNNLQRTLEPLGCAWNLRENTRRAAAEAIREFAATSHETVSAMGAKGREWVRDSLRYDQFAQQIQYVAMRCGRLRDT